MRKYIVTILLTGGTMLSTWSQQLDREVLVTKDYVPVIQDAERITVQPDVNDSIQIKPGFNYRIYPIAAKTSFELKPIKAAKLTGIPVSELYNYKIMAGLGNHHLPVLNVQANNLRSNNYIVGAVLDIQNEEGRVTLENDQKLNATNSSINLTAYGKKFFDGFTLEGNTGIDFQKYHYYGLDPDTVYDPLPKAKELKQNFNTLFISSGLHSSNPNSKLHASFFLDEKYTWDRFEFFENDFNFGVKSKAVVKFLDIHIDMDYQSLKNNLENDSSMLKSYIGISPYIANNSGDFRYSVGLNLNIEVENGESSPYLYPRASIEYNMAQSVLTTYFNLSGRLKPSTYHGLLDANPYVTAGTQVKPADNSLNAVAGIKGNIVKNLEFNVSGEISSTKNYALFTIDTMGMYNSNYKVVYADLDRIRIGGSFLYSFYKKFSVSLEGNKYMFEAGEQQHAWHLPQWETDLTLRYNLQDKVLFTGDLGIVGKRHALNVSEEVVELKSFAVFDLKVDYMFSKALSAFLNLKNLNASQFDIWYQYPYFKTMVLVGAVYKF